MRVLAIETATAVCGAATVESGTVRAERFVEAQQVHSQKILGLIDDVLRSTPSALQDIDGVAVSIGPGSFTGLRVGLSTAKGLAYALDKPITAVSTLEAVAFNAVRHANFGDGILLLPMIDARRNDVYVASYRMQGNALEQVMAPCAIVLAELYELLGSEENVAPVGEAAEKFYQFVSMKQPDRSDRFIRSPREHSLCSAAAVGILGEQQFQRGMCADIASLVPLYVKEFFTKMKPLTLEHR